MDEYPDLPFQAAAREVAVALARAFLAGENTPGAMRERGTRALGHSWPWLIPLTLHLHFQLTQGNAWHPGLHDEIVALILAFPPFLAAFEPPEEEDDFFLLSQEPPQELPQVRGHYPYHPPMGTPPAALFEVRLPTLATPGDLADWLGISPNRLDWFANVAGWDTGATAPKLEHYHARWVAKANGGIRLIEAPKEELRAIQRRILRGILDRVPAHPAAHGCV
ncbi:MAG: hypothetical protein LBB76_00855, partial [Azoarcus sp.]|nr:hypothetical protein [Azoarcus sp.]